MPWFAGMPRKEIPWFPTIDESKCISCGMCMNCGKKVYEWDEKENKPKVVRPYDCVAGCSTCANLCHGRAILFPDIKDVLKIYAKNKIWDAVKEELIKQGVLPASAREQVVKPSDETKSGCCG